MGICITESDIQSYMKEFKLTREEAIKNIEEALEYYYAIENKKLQKIYTE